MATNKRTHITFSEKLKVMEWLKSLGQKAIDDGRMSLQDLADKARQSCNCNVTRHILQGLMGECGLTASAPLRNEFNNRLQKGQEKQGASGIDEGTLAAAVNNLAAAVLLLVEKMPTDQSRAIAKCECGYVNLTYLCPECRTANNLPPEQQ